MKYKNFELRDQILQSNLSIPSNIIEGYESGSNKDFIRFLNIARSSCDELRTQIHLAIQTNFLKREKRLELINETKEISAMITGLINKRKNFNKKQK